MNVQSDKQVVTVAVITYHSAATVVETLDSIVSQTYGPENVELIISDDGSKDNTIDIIEQWLVEHKCRFHCVKLFANPVNGGISKNCNVAWMAATSEWIKTIAGDDILLANCLFDNVEYTKNNKSCSAIFSMMQSFKSDGHQIKEGKRYPEDYRLSFFDKDAEQQLSVLLTDSFNFAPTSFLKNDLLREVGYAESSYKLIEDLPLWIKITSTGAKLYFLKKVTVLYRCSESISMSNEKFINQSFVYDLLRLHSEIIYPRLRSTKDYLMYFDKIYLFKSFLFVAKITGNKKGYFARCLFLFTSLLRPSAYINKLKKAQRFFNSMGEHYKN